MTQAPSIKEALTNLQVWCDEQGSKLGAVDGYDYHSGEEAAYRHVAIEIKKRLEALATFQPEGEGRETIALAEMVYKAIKFADEAAGEGICFEGLDPALILCDYAQAIGTDCWDGMAEVARDAILASGLVQNEAGEKVTLLLRIIDAAGGEIDATENVHSLLNYFCDDRGGETDTYNLAINQGLIESSFNDMFETSRAWLTDAGRAAIRSARDGDNNA